nr:helix-turn-helix transcriptional regulator [Brevundimonas alba]
MLFAHAAYVREALHRLDLAHADRLGRAFLDLLALALAEARTSSPSPVGAEKALRRRAAEEIEKRLGSGGIAVSDLCRALDVSRGRLFAAFQSDGGVQAYIMTERLGRARVALADIDRAEPIGGIAHRLGFSDAPHLSRAFRQRYGMTPREYRRLLTTDRELLRASEDAGSSAPD